MPKEWRAYARCVLDSIAKIYRIEVRGDLAGDTQLPIRQR